MKCFIELYFYFWKICASLTSTYNLLGLYLHPLRDQEKLITLFFPLSFFIFVFQCLLLHLTLISWYLQITCSSYTSSRQTPGTSSQYIQYWAHSLPLQVFSLFLTASVKLISKYFFFFGILNGSPICLLAPSVQTCFSFKLPQESPN